MKTLQQRVTECEQRRPGISRGDVARAAGVKPPSVSDWFNGKTAALKLRPAIGAARIWGCDALWLGEGIGAPGWAEAHSATTALPAPAQPLDLAAALEVVGIALAVELPDDVRQDAADLLAKLAHRRGASRHQAELLALLNAPPAKRQSNG